MKLKSLTYVVRKKEKTITKRDQSKKKDNKFGLQ